MRAWVVTGAGEPADVLVRRDVDAPDPGPGSVRLAVDAAGLGMPDVLMCRGTYPLTPEPPFTPGQEVVGRVTAVGEGVDPALLGERLMGVTAFYLGAGGCAEETLAAAATVYPAPAVLDDVEAAGFHIPFHTAWHGLVDRAGVDEGETLVVLGAAGGSGTAAVLLGVVLGAHVIAVAGGEKAQVCRELGAHEVIDHRRADVAGAIRELTDGHGADVVYDPVGGTLGETAASVMADEGRFLLVGFAAGRWPTIDPGRIVNGNFSVMGVFAGAYDADHTADVARELTQLVEDGRLGSPPIAVVGFDDVPAALGRIAHRSAVGKTVVRMTGG